MHSGNSIYLHFRFSHPKAPSHYASVNQFYMNRLWTFVNELLNITLRIYTFVHLI